MHLTLESCDLVSWLKESRLQKRQQQAAEELTSKTCKNVLFLYLNRFRTINDDFRSKLGGILYIKRKFYYLQEIAIA